LVPFRSILSNASIAVALTAASLVRDCSRLVAQTACGPNAPRAETASRRTSVFLLLKAFVKAGMTCSGSTRNKPRTWIDPHAIPMLPDEVAPIKTGMTLVPADGCCPKAQIAHIGDHSEKQPLGKAGTAAAPKAIVLGRTATPSGP